MAQAAGRRRASALQWLFTALALGYAALIHHGIGPIPGRQADHWYEPRDFLDDFGFLAPVLETTPRALVGLALPAVLLAAAVFLSGRSAIARALALSSVFATLLFTFYGIEAESIWEFFYWRGSAVMVVTALCVGFAAAAPFLARSWLQRSWPMRLLLYLPVALGVIAFLRNATGTNPSLRFAISPWPAVPVFGIELGALFVFVVLAGVAVGVHGVAAARGPRRWLWLSLGLVTPGALLALGSTLGLLPFRLGPRVAGVVTLGCAATVVLVAAVRGAPGALALRARAIAVGAALIGLPLVTGQAWARLDYYVTREHRARAITDALQTYLEKEELYPDELEQLVPDYLDAIPEPAIGFGFLYDGRFRYRSFGTSFILEFPAPRWVECAYTPPYEGQDELGEDDFFANEYVDAPEGEGEASEDWFVSDDSLGESWSCPSRPPELW